MAAGVGSAAAAAAGAAGSAAAGAAERAAPCRPTVGWSEPFLTSDLRMVARGTGYAVGRGRGLFIFTPPTPLRSKLGMVNF